MKRILNWIAVDGLLHLLVCYSIILTIAPIINLWWAISITIIIASIKEIVDYFYQKDNNLQQVLHDLICGFVGMFGALIVMFLW
jgi:hypothetical protein